MAAGTPKLLTGSDRVTPALLTHVSRHVRARNRMQFATEALGLTTAHIENKEDAFQNNPGRVHLELLQDWIARDLSINVGVLMEKLVVWIQDGYLSSEVLSDVEKLVRSKVPPAPTVSSSQREKQPELKSGHLLQLTGQVVEKMDLYKLADKLGMDKAKVDIFLIDGEGRQDAAYKLLTTWQKGQEDSSKAYYALLNALRESELNMLAGKLKQIVVG